MHKGFLLISMLIIITTLCVGCDTHTDTNLPYDIRGTWEYTMLAQDGNTYDAGTITFEGTPSKGTYTQLNIYDIDYEGEYMVKGTTVKVTGDESWQGTITNAIQMNGTWSHRSEDSGTWSAVKQNP